MGTRGWPQPHGASAAGEITSFPRPKAALGTSVPGLPLPGCRARGTLRVLTAALGSGGEQGSTFSPHSSSRFAVAKRSGRALPALPQLCPACSLRGPGCSTPARDGCVFSSVNYGRQERAD